MVRLGNLTGLNQRREEEEEEEKEEENMEAGKRDGSVRGQGAAGGAVDVGSTGAKVGNGKVRGNTLRVGGMDSTARSVFFCWTFVRRQKAGKDTRHHRVMELAHRGGLTPIGVMRIPILRTVPLPRPTKTRSFQPREQSGSFMVGTRELVRARGRGAAEIRPV